jgi:hypothetical protein
LISIVYTSEALGGAAGNTTSGTGDLDDTLSMPVGSSVTYTVSATVSEAASGTLSNTASVTTPDDMTELDPSYNTDNETNLIESPFADISGSVYVDLNDNGIFEPDEPPIPDVAIILFQDEVELRQTTTNEDGDFLFDNLDPDAYIVQQIQPAGFQNGQTTIDGDLGEVIDDDTIFVALEAGDSATGFNFGELPLRPSKRDLMASRFVDFEFPGEVE